MKRAVLYVRVSTTEQAQGHSLEAQESKLLSYCKHNNIEIVKLYKDEFSAKDGFNRPKYNLFLSDLKEKKIKNVDYFIVTNFSRFSRNLTDALNQKKIFIVKKK
jgi:site-specific DNA recombinase